MRATDPPVSEAQRKAMGAAMSGNSNIGIPKSVGKEFIGADPGGSLPEKSHSSRRDKMSEKDGGPGSGPKPGGGSGTFSAGGMTWPTSTRPSKDMTKPDPASGPMATGGPNGTSESLPKTVEPFSEVKDARKPSDCMSLDEIKAMNKRIGRY